MNGNTKKHEIEELRAFADDFKNESDRAAVVLGAARLDLLLYQVLQAKLVPNPPSRDDMLDQDGPIATFSARIQLCHRLGLIPSDFARALHLVRKIRNDFAHESGAIRLDAGAHKDRIKELVRPFRGHDALTFFIKTFFDDQSSASTEFRAVVTIMSLRLNGLRKTVSPCDQSETQALVPPPYEADPKHK